MIFKTFLNAFLAGFALGIAGTVNLSVGGGIPGAFLFGFGLFLILSFSFKLFTGAVGYLADQSGARILPYLASLGVIWAGNFVGAAFVGEMIRYSRLAEKIAPAAARLCEVKLADSASSILILSFFCGFLMFVAVDSFRREEAPPLFRVSMVFLCVMIFILSGFEHCIANMFYFAASGMLWETRGGHLTIIWILLMTLGNSIGGCFLPIMNKIRR